MEHRHRLLIAGLIVVAATAAIVLIAPGASKSLAQGDIIYVDGDATGTDTGEDWENAYNDLQDALAAAGSGDQIWVAEGIYKPTSGTERTISFQMVNGVAIYGGFDPSAGDTEWEERDWVANLTVLSGDIGNQGDDSDNSFHVFYHSGANLDSTAILDGFTITGGNANGDYLHHSGGGMLNFFYSSPTLTNVTFSGNSARSGGGMFNVNSSPTLTNCTFAGNSAQGGGGMYNSTSSPTLTNCTFTGNSATVYNGGGMYNDGSSPLLTNCILWGDSPDEIFGDMGTVTYSDIEAGYTGTGNIDADPLFVDPSSGDFHLWTCSPCIDAGDNTPPNLPLQDFEGDARIVDGDGDGELVVDMGVDEVAVAGTCSRIYLPLVLRNY